MYRYIEPLVFMFGINKFGRQKKEQARCVYNTYCFVYVHRYGILNSKSAQWKKNPPVDPWIHRIRPGSSNNDQN